MITPKVEKTVSNRNAQPTPFKLRQSKTAKNGKELKIFVKTYDQKMISTTRPGSTKVRKNVELDMEKYAKKTARELSKILKERFEKTSIVNTRERNYALTARRNCLLIKN